MKPTDILWTALGALRGNWLRSVLTALGVIIGIAAVIVMVSVGQGTQAELDRVIQNLGSNRIDIGSNFSRRGGVRGGAGSVFSLRSDDVDRLRESIPEIEFISGVVQGNAQLINAEQNWQTRWQGVEDDFFRINDWRLAEGEWIDEAAHAGARTQAMIGQTVREQLFGDLDPVGATIRVGRVPFTVSGVLAPKGQSNWGQDQDDVVFVPLETARRRLLGQVNLPPGTVMQIVVGVGRADDMEYAEARITEVLREGRRTAPGADDEFTVRNLSQIVSTRTQTTRLMSLLLGAVATISLIVGGIGIMNIMLVSVTERIREIGLRMAVGAGPRAIQQQFLAEAMLISLGGGLIGIVLGIGGSIAMGHFTTLPVQLNLQVIGLATAFSVATGLFFGFYPARKAARLDPIEALRHQG
ncbi:MAG: ABC transporter permease [Lysobacteraceae bacterium]